MLQLVPSEAHCLSPLTVRSGRECTDIFRLGGQHSRPLRVTHTGGVAAHTGDTDGSTSNSQRWVLA